jgi:hypothetical protein
MLHTMRVSTLVAVAVVAFAAAGCAAGEPVAQSPAVPGDIRAPAAAIARFQVEWRRLISPSLPHMPPEMTDQQLADYSERAAVWRLELGFGYQPGNADYLAWSNAFDASAVRCSGATDDPPDHAHVLVGSTASAARHDRCWEVTFIPDAGPSCETKASVTGYVTADTGELMLASYR